MGCTGLSFLPQREQQFPLLGELHHLVAADVGGPHVARRVDPQSVGRSKHSFSPRAKIAALGVENNHRISAVATVKDEHFSPCVDCHGGDASELPARRHRIVIAGRGGRADQFLAKTKVDAIFQQCAFARGPALWIGCEHRHGEKQEDRFHLGEDYIRLGR